MSRVLRAVRKRKKVRRLGAVDIIRREAYADLELDAKVELIRALVQLGLLHVQELRDQEVTALAGARYARKDESVEGRRHGSNPGTVGLAGQRVPIRVPRISHVVGSEIPLRSYEAMRGDRAVDDLLLRRVLYGISCRNYEAAAKAIPGAIGLSSSTVSRGFIQASAAQLRAFQERDLSEEDVAAVFLDGKTFADATMVIALGITITGEKRFLGFVEERQFPTSWVADGNVMTLHTEHPDTARDLYVLAMDGDLTPEPFLATAFQERGASFSPDGQWIAYVSDESGRDEVYVRPYPGPGGQVIISTGGGAEVVWGPDGSVLFYRNGDQVMVVAVTTGQTFSAETPAPLFAAPYPLDTAGAGGTPNYDIAPDGEQFIFVEQNSSTGGEGSAQIHVVLNWHQELTTRVPVP